LLADDVLHCAKEGKKALEKELSELKIKEFSAKIAEPLCFTFLKFSGELN